jgi:hypothetical protein
MACQHVSAMRHAGLEFTSVPDTDPNSRAGLDVQTVTKYAPIDE